MDIVLMIVYATIVLGFLVFIHEGGHYLAARAFGVRVTEFMLGLPGPSIGFTRAGTRFGVTAVPLGGYAKVCGMEAGEMSPHLEPVLAALYRRGTANMEDVAADCGITPDEAYDALDELAEWGSVVGPTKKDQYNTYRAPAVRLTKKQRAALAAAPAKGVGAGAEGVRAAAGAPAALAGAGMGGANVAAGAEGVRAAVGAGGSVPADDSTPAAPARMALANSPVPLRDYELGEPREVADAHALFESEYRQQYRSLPFWKRSVILVAGVGVNLLFAIALFIVWLSVIGIDGQTSTGEVVHVTLNPLEAIQFGFMYIGAVIQAVAGLFNPATAAQTVSDSASIIGIAVMSKDFFEAGLVSIMQFFAMLSVSLGIMTCCPFRRSTAAASWWRCSRKSPARWCPRAQ